MNAFGAKSGTTSDSFLLQRIARKDEEAFSALYDRYSAPVFSTAKRILRGSGEAEEILQDVFYQVSRTAGRFDPAKGSLAGWLLVTTRNRAIAKLRRTKDVREDFDENGVSLGARIESHAAQRLLAERLRGALAGLPSGQRAALECAYFQGMSHSEIAEKMGQPPAAVKTLLHAAMEALKKVSG